MLEAPLKIKGQSRASNGARNGRAVARVLYAKGKARKMQ